MPPKILDGIIKALARFAYFFDTRRKKVALTNLDFAFDGSLDLTQKREIILYCYQNLLYNVTSIISNIDLTKEELLSKCEFEGDEEIKTLLSRGQKVIIITAHYGNWEVLCNAISARLNIKIVIVGRELDASALNKPLKASRERFGSELVSKKGAMKHLVKALKNGNVPGILVDQNTLKNEGVLVSFFGKSATQTPVASILARRFNAAIVPVFCLNIGFDKYKISFCPAIYAQKSENIDEDIRLCTQAQSDAIEKEVRANPKGWLWFHRRWRTTYRELYD